MYCASVSFPWFWIRLHVGQGGGGGERRKNRLELGNFCCFVFSPPKFATVTGVSKPNPMVLYTPAYGLQINLGLPRLGCRRC